MLSIEGPGGAATAHRRCALIPFGFWISLTAWPGKQPSHLESFRDRRVTQSRFLGIEIENSQQKKHDPVGRRGHCRTTVPPEGVRAAHSKFGGVQFGIIVAPYNFHSVPLAAGKFLDTLVQLNINAVEMQHMRVEACVGASNPRVE
jgi:hypothetical protein